MLSATEALDRFVRGLDDAGKAELDRLIEPELSKLWLPDPDNGPQLEAYLSEADLLLYGGAAGGGKTDLLIGCALDATQAVIFRRQYKDLQGIEDRLIEITGGEGYNRGPPKVWRGEGRKLELDHLGEPGSELSHQGRARDFIGFDEGAQLSPYRVKFVLGWLRSATARRRRSVIATNPPMGGEGIWLIEWFAPWLDPMFPRPAKPGELRWAVVVGGQDEVKTLWVDGPEPVWVEDQKVVRLATPEEAAAKPPLPHVFVPLSRTYIPARLDDNKYLRDTGYRAQINAMPEPLRSQLLYGDFLAGRKDDPWQVIPSAWVRAAQERWTKREHVPRERMLHMGVDVAQGGSDRTVVACLRGLRFDPLADMPGKDTPDPVSVVQLILSLRRDDAGITVDHGGGYGSGVSSHLQTHNGIVTCKFVPGEGAGGTTRDGKLTFLNRRAFAWWTFREALNPDNPDHDLIELPPDTRLLSELTAPLWKTRGAIIVIEGKDDIRKRLGTSTDRADAVIMAWIDRGKSIVRKASKAVQASTTVEPVSPFADL